MVVKTASLTLPIPSERQSHYVDYKQRSVLLGIRPESIYFPAYAPPGIVPCEVSAQVTVIELMGHELIIYFTVSDGQEFVARLDPRAQVKPGEAPNLQFDLSRFHLFDKETEQVI